MQELSKKIEFFNEYDFEGKKVTGCIIRKPRLKDRNQALRIARLNKADDEETDNIYFSIITDLPKEFFDDVIFSEDFGLINRANNNFLGLGTKISATL